MTFRELEKLIKKDGWILKRVQGSHFHYCHPTKSGIITIPNHKGDIKIGLVHAILKQAGLK